MTARRILWVTLAGPAVFFGGIVGTLVTDNALWFLGGWLGAAALAVVALFAIRAFKRRLPPPTLEDELRDAYGVLQRAGLTQAAEYVRGHVPDRQG